MLNHIKIYTPFPSQNNSKHTPNLHLLINDSSPIQNSVTCGKPRYFLSFCLSVCLCPSIHPSIHPNCLSVSISFHLTARLLKHTTFSHSTDSLIEPDHLHTQNTLEPLFCALSVSACPSVSQTNNLSIYLSIHLSIYPSVRPLIHPSIHPYFLSVCISFHLTDRQLKHTTFSRTVTDSLICQGHLHRKKHTEPSFCVLSIPPSINQSINQSVRPSAMSVCSFVGLTVRPSIHPFIQPSILTVYLSVYFFI